MAAHPNPPPPIALPAPPDDDTLILPAAPVFPPTRNDVHEAVRYRKDVEISITNRFPIIQCSPDDHYNAVLYEFNTVRAAAAAADPQAAAADPQAAPPPWFQNAAQQLRNDISRSVRIEIVPDLKRQMNMGRGHGNIMPFEIVPFIDGSDPTLPPHNLPPLRSVVAIEGLTGQNLVRYLNGYGFNPLPIGENPVATNRLRKETLKIMVGVSMPL
ncbi:hypothetical protein BJY52DRAFT_1295830 [Lactarius psammicola]|nr:hypothetical protein BJY52DRAFT_1295830 [Lactarius psammicola]